MKTYGTNSMLYLKGIPSGVYILTVRTDKKVHSIPLIKR